MNKNELIARIAESANITKAAAAKATDAFMEVVSAALQRQEEVRLVGFGTFSVTHRRATEGRNPKTGEKIQIPASKLPKFKPGKSLKDLIA